MSIGSYNTFENSNLPEMIMSTMNDDFAEWLNAELRNREWSQAELARRAGVSRAAISDIASGKHKIGKDVATGIARAFKMQPVTVFRAAGILPPEPEYVPLLDEWNAVFYELTPDEQEELLDIARMKVNRRKTGKPETKKKSSRVSKPRLELH
jgi:transcriptional regulator with XRE-family HTH domain